jgi:L-fuconolactonase
MRIDSHQHFWDYDPTDYPWIKSEWPIRRSFLPEDLRPELAASSIDGCVAVQARQCNTESAWLLDLSRRCDFIKGVVGWVDLRAGDVARQLAEFAPEPKFVGVRHVVQDEPDDDFLLAPKFQRGISELKQFNLTYDLLIFPRQLPAAIKTVTAHPSQPFVLDHIAKPSIKTGAMEPWRGLIRDLGRRPNVYCKVSGMVTEADWQNWRPADFRPFLDVVFEAFGPDRLMFGSDWPVALLAGTYQKVYDLAREYVQPMGKDVEAKFFGANAAKFYGI